MKQIAEIIGESKIIAIVRGVDSGFSSLAQALYEGGIRAIEVAFDHSRPDSYSKTADAISQIVACMGDQMAVGAGTVTSAALVRLAYQAGAQFIVSPDTNPEVIRQTKTLGLVSMPGALTPTEITQAYLSGADFVKVFPAGVLGPSYIKAVCAPLGHIPLLAVGGVDAHTIAAFINAGCAGVGVGGSLVRKQWVKEGRWAELTALAKQYHVNACR